MLFKEVVGQNKIKEILIQDAKADRLSHALLFQDLNGYGALPLILALVQYIYCENKTDDDSCGECASCKKVSKLAHPDLHFSFPIQLGSGVKVSDNLLNEWKELIQEKTYFSEEDWYKKTGNENKTGVIGKDESQNIIKKLQLKSFEGKYKIVIIYGIERLNIAAANKLLKMIEEPPSKTLFFMSASALDNILPTILSRSQVIKLKKPLNQEIESYLSKKGVDATKAEEITHFVNGNVSLASSLSEQQEEVDDFFNLFVEWMRICFSRDVAKAIDYTTNLSKLGKEKQKAFLSYSLDVFQKSLTGNFTSINHIRIKPSQKKFIENFMPYINPGNIQKLYQMFTDAHLHVNRNANTKILFLDLSFKMFGQIKK